MKNNSNISISNLRMSERLICITQRRVKSRLLVLLLVGADEDVVDGDEHELDGVADEAHDAEADGAGGGDLLELLRVGLVALRQQSPGVGHEFAQTYVQITHWVVLVRDELLDCRHFLSFTNPNLAMMLYLPFQRRAFFYDENLRRV